MLNKAEAAKELLRRRNARKNLIDFIQYLDPDYILSDFARSVCASLQQFLSDLNAGLRPVLVLQAPPQHGKSQIVSRYLPAWIFGQNPDLCLGGLSYSKDLASDMNRDVQRIMMSEEYAILFPESSLNSRRVVTIDVEAKRNSEVFELVGRKGRYVSQGVGGPLTGKRLDIGIIDDPIKNAQEALSPVTKLGIWNWYITTFLTRLSKNSGQIIMATSWALDDLSGRVIESTKKAKVLKFAAIDENGNALVPELHPIEKLLETKATMSDYFWSAMYQQKPIAIGGNLFKSHWFKYYDVLPRMQWRGIYVDTAQKTKEQHDWTVFQCWGCAFDGGQAYLIDQVRGKWEAPELLIQGEAFWNKHRGSENGTLRSYSIEDKVSGTGLIQTLRRKGIPIKAIQRDVDKMVRAMDAAPLMESGNVFLPRTASFLSEYLEEFGAFPNGPHDDQIDPTMDALNDILSGDTIDYSKLV